MLDRRLSLNIAVVAPGGEASPMVDDLACGLTARGHRVRVYRPDAGYARVFRRVRAEGSDVVSDHAGDPDAIAFAEGLPVLHTLPVLPAPALVEACARSRARFAVLSALAEQQWRAAGLERLQRIAPGLADFPLPPTVVRPVAVVDERAGAMAALRAGLGIAMQAMLPGRRQLWDKLARSAVCIVARDVDWLAVQAQLAGCPVVGYASGALPELVEDGVSGLLVAPGDAAALSAAARRALTLGRRGVRESARARLSAAPMLDRYEAELRALARRSAVRLVA